MPALFLFLALLSGSASPSPTNTPATTDTVSALTGKLRHVKHFRHSSVAGSGGIAYRMASGPDAYDDEHAEPSFLTAKTTDGAVVPRIHAPF